MIFSGIKSRYIIDENGINKKEYYFREYLFKDVYKETKHDEYGFIASLYWSLRKEDIKNTNNFYEWCKKNNSEDLYKHIENFRNLYEQN